jgi:AraC-like DNA-binding protein
MGDILGHPPTLPVSLDDVAPEYLAHLADVVAHLGVRTDKLLAGSGITPALLERAELTLSRERFFSVVERALALTGEPGLGFHFGLSLKLSSHGPVGLLAMTSQTLQDAISVAERYIQLRATQLTFRTRLAGDELAIEFSHAVPQHLQVFFTEAFFATLLHVGRALVGRTIAGVCEMAFAEPPHFRRFAHLLPASVRFQAPANRLLVPAHTLELMVVTSDSVTARRVERECKAELAQLEERASFLSQIRRDVRASGGYPSLEEIADRRGLSTRTLKRKLLAHGTHYRRLIDELRRERAIELLRGSEHSIERVAHLLGYTDAASFHRSFRRWFQTTPEVYRRSAP